MKKSVLLIVLFVLALSVSSALAEDPAALNQLTLFDLFNWEQDRVAISNILSQYTDIACGAAMDPDMNLVINCKGEEIDYDFTFKLTGEFLRLVTSRTLPADITAEAAADEIRETYKFDEKEAVSVADVPTKNTWSDKAEAVKDGDIYIILDTPDKAVIEFIDAGKIE